MRLSEKIKKAYSDIECPEKELTSCGCPECREIRGYFSKTSRYEISEEKLDYYDNALCLLTPEAFHYFISAWLLADCDSNDGSTLIEHLSDADFADRRLTLFTKEQIEVLLEFVEILKEKEQYPDLEEYERAIEHLTRRSSGREKPRR